MNMDVSFPELAYWSVNVKKIEKIHVFFVSAASFVSPLALKSSLEWRYAHPS